VVVKGFWSRRSTMEAASSGPGAASTLAELMDVKLREAREEVLNRCLFCKLEVQGKRQLLFAHMWEEHHFHMGHPDNMVHIDEVTAPRASSW
jgi:hypothetical protein